MVEHGGGRRLSATVEPQIETEDFRKGAKAVRRSATVSSTGYQDYIQSKEWDKKKREYRRSRLPQCCVVCGDSKVDLHHRSYKRLGDEYLTDLIPLCRTHHEALHRYHKESGLPLWKATTKYVRSHGKTLRGRTRGSKKRRKRR